MSCKNTNKKSKSSGFDINTISGILNTLLAVFMMPEQANQSFPFQYYNVSVANNYH